MEAKSSRGNRFEITANTKRTSETIHTTARHLTLSFKIPPGKERLNTVNSDSRKLAVAVVLNAVKEVQAVVIQNALKRIEIW